MTEKEKNKKQLISFQFHNVVVNFLISLSLCES